MTITTVAAWAQLAKADDFSLSMSVLDSMLHTVSKSLTGLDYTTYQARRLNLQPGKRFDPLLHATVAKLPLCGETDKSVDWIEWRCRFYEVLPRTENCASNDFSRGYCMNFKVAPFVARSPELLHALERGLVEVGNSSPTDTALKKDFGVTNLHAPGLSLSPRADEIGLKIIQSSGRTVRIKKVSENIYMFNLDNQIRQGE